MWYHQILFQNIYEYQLFLKNYLTNLGEKWCSSWLGLEIICMFVSLDVLIFIEYKYFAYKKQI